MTDGLIVTEAGAPRMRELLLPLTLMMNGR